MAGRHPSDSEVQLKAEGAIVDALAEQLCVPLEGGGSLRLSGGATIQLDARSADGKIAVEAYAHQGPLKGGQRKKVAQDILKLALLRNEPNHAAVRSILVFSSEEARSSIAGWVQSAADTFGVELTVVDIGEDLRSGIRAAQKRQEMVNVPVSPVADDVTLES